MKQLMLGNAAAARGLYEAGCCVISSYPGTPSTEITEAAAKYPEIYAEWAPNEKVAMEAAFGASLAGRRSFCGMKHVGLNVAADPLFTISYTGVNAGMVIAVADDGVGMEQAAVDAMLAKAEGFSTEEKGTGIALRNVAERLERFFGVGSGVDIVSRPDEGTVVTLRLAAVEGPDPDGADVPEAAGIGNGVQ